MTIWSAPIPQANTHDRAGDNVRNPTACGAALAARGGGDYLSHSDCRRRDAFDGIRFVDRGVEANRRRPASAVRKRMACRIREIPDHSAISGAQSRHEPGCIQDDLLVGMVAPAVGKTDGRRFSFAISGFSGARHNSAQVAGSIVDHFCRRCSARRCRLVDGFLRALARRERLAISTRIPPYARQCDLWSDRLDCAAARTAGAG